MKCSLGSEVMGMKNSRRRHGRIKYRIYVVGLRHVKVLAVMRKASGGYHDNIL